jgi:hypothetical protein
MRNCWTNSSAFPNANTSEANLLDRWIVILWHWRRQSVELYLFPALSSRLKFKIHSKNKFMTKSICENHVSASGKLQQQKKFRNVWEITVLWWGQKKSLHVKCAAVGVFLLFTFRNPTNSHMLSLSIYAHFNRLRVRQQQTLFVFIEEWTSCWITMLTDKIFSRYFPLSAQTTLKLRRVSSLSFKPAFIYFRRKTRVSSVKAR